MLLFWWKGRAFFFYVDFIKSKNEVLEKFKIYIAKVQNKFGKSPKMLLADKDCGLCDHECQKSLEENGIQYKATVEYCPEISADANKLVENVLCMTKHLLLQANLPE